MRNHYKEHYKLYKSGKLWVTAMLATGALVTTTTVAKADTITNSQAAQTPNTAVVSSDANRDGKTSATSNYALSASTASANDESNVQTEKATPSDGTTTALSSNQVSQSENQVSATSNALASAQPSQALKATASSQAPQALSSDLEQKLLAVTTNDLQTKYPVNTGTNVVLSDNWSQMSNDQKVALAQAFLGSDDSIDQTTIDPTDLAMTLNYFDRLYNFTIGSVNVRDLILRDRRKIGSTATAADLLAAIQSQANQTSKQLLSGNNSATFFNQKLAPLLNTKDLPTTIEAWIDQFDPQYQGKYNQWFADTFAGVVVDTAPIESLAGLDFSAWANAKRVNNGNIILPLLTKGNEHTYLAGIPIQLVVGSMANYTSDFSAESKAKFKQKIQNWASGMRSYFNTWTKINPPSVTAIKSKIGMSVDSNGSQTATTATDPTIRNFYNLANIIVQSSASAFSNGRDLFIVKAHLLDSGRLYSHEYTHVIDQSVLMNGLGRRANAGAETFTIGMFEQYFTDGNLDVNLSANFDKSKLISTNWTPERVNSPEKFQDFYHKLFQVLDLLDYLQGQAFLKLDQTTQSFVGRLNSGNTPSYDPNDPGKVRVFERLSPAKYAGIIQKPTSLADLINDKLGMYPGEDRITAVKRNDYSSPSIYDANWYEGHYDAGVADSLAVQYMAYQMAGEAGYQDGMLKVITGNRTDLELLREITGDPTMTFAKFKEQRYQATQAMLDNPSLGLDEEVLINKFVQAMQNDKNNRQFNNLPETNQLRRNLYYMLKRVTNDFTGDLVNNSYQVTVNTAQELINAINQDPYADIVIKQDLDFSQVKPNSSTYTRLGTFSGRLDGQNHTIINLSKPLFNKLSLAYVQNLKINDGKSDGQDASAKLVAQAKPSAIFANVLSTTQTPTTQQTFTLNYVDVDNDNQVVHTTTVRGKVGEKVTVPNEVPTGYVALDQVPAEYTFTSDNQSVTVRLKHDTKQSTDQQDITRKINITNPQTGEVTTEQQTVTLTRQGTTDLVTGHTTYGDWSTGRLAAFQVPAFVGYTPVIMVNGQVVKAIDEVAVDYTTAPITVAVTYTAIAQETPQVTEIRYLDDDQNGQLVKVTSLKGKVDEKVAVTIDVPTNYQLVGNVPTSYTFKATDNQPLAIHLTHKHQQAQATKTITRQLELLDPRTNTKTQQQQKVTLTLTKDTDLVTGKTTEAWTTGEWPAYQVPKLDGYTANLDQVVASTVDHTMEDQTVMIRYEANPQTSYIEYIDNDQSTPAKQFVLTLPLLGVTGQTIEVHYQTPTNYIVENPAAAVPTYTFSTHNLPIRIYLKHQISEILKTKAITRTINIAMPDQQQRVVKQTVTFKRTDHQDLVTKVTTEGDWQVDQVAAWSAYTIPEIPGYEANLTSLPAVVVTPMTADQTVNVAYQLKQQTVEVWYQDIDSGNSVVRVSTLQGTMGETVKVPISVPAHFDLVGTVPSTYTFKLENNDPIRIQVKHHKRTKQVVGEATRTIYVNYPDGHRDTITQVTNPKWTEVYDEATGRTTQEDRQNGEWAAFQAPEIPGYVASTPLIPQVAVFPQEGDVVATITYTAAPQSVTLVYVDDQTGRTVQTENLAGQTGQVVAVKVNIPENYRYQGGAPDTYLLKAENNTPIIIHLQHQTKVILETHVANRTITIVFPDGTTHTMQDQQTIQRENVQDLVTGEVTPGHWSKANWAAVTIPVVADYTASQTTVPSEAILPTTADQEITITYTANQKPLTHQVVTVQYQDTVTGKLIKTVELTGKVGETVAISINLPQGYLVQGTVPTSYTFTDQNEVIVIMLGHQTKASAETKTVTRTIKLTLPDHREQVVPQVVTLTRIKITDQVTGEETFGPWSTATWTAYQIPTIPGFTPSLTQAPKQVVTALTDNQTLSVTYQAIPQATIIQYVDQTTGAVIATTSLNGKTGETVAIMPSAPTGYQLVGTVPATYTFNAADNPAVMIKVVAKDQSATTNPNGQATPTDNATTPEPTKPNQDEMAHQSGVDQKQSATVKGANQILQSTGQPVMDTTPEVTGLGVSDNHVADQTGNSKPVNGLPQTGNNPQVKLTVVGLIFASLSVLLGFGRKLTRKH